MITEGQRLMITNMVNTELKNIDNTVYCKDELIALRKALNIDDVSKCECGETKDLITVCEDCTYKMVSEGN